MVAAALPLASPMQNCCDFFKSQIARLLIEQKEKEEKCNKIDWLYDHHRRRISTAHSTACQLNVGMAGWLSGQWVILVVNNREIFCNTSQWIHKQSVDGKSIKILASTVWLLYYAAATSTACLVVACWCLKGRRLYTYHDGMVQVIQAVQWWPIEFNLRRRIFSGCNKIELEARYAEFVCVCRCTE